jgi:hypothetical protein
MTNVYGQPPHFDNNDPYFDPVGETYSFYTPPTLKSGGKAILYGSGSTGSRKNLCIRRYVYQYISMNDNFNYYKTYKGVKNFEQPDNVIDISELNSRSLVHSSEVTGESEPTFITQSILKSLFSFPSNNSYFFIEGVHSIAIEKEPGDFPNLPIPNFFKIYRYGKITQNNIVIVYKNNNIERRPSTI